MKKLVLIRHGQSEWNKKNLFTGWVDVPLSPEGKEEAIQAGRLLKEKNIVFDCAFTSVLKRASDTLSLILKEMNLNSIPIYKSWNLNERHYGALQGKNKNEVKKKYGQEQFKLWRRSYTIRPPLLEEDASDKLQKKQYCDSINNIHDNKPLKQNTDKNHSYPNIKVPRGESLKDTLERVIPYWKKNIMPFLKDENTVLISAHGNSLRALIKKIEHISDSEIIKLEIPTGQPRVYEIDDNFKFSHIKDA